MPTWLEITVGVVSAVSLIAGLLGALVHYALLPWLQANLIAPIAARFDTITEDTGRISQEVRIAGVMWEGHVDRSGADRASLRHDITALQDEHRAIWRALHDLQTERNHV